MKFGHIAFCMLIISLSYILWDYWNIGTLSFILKYDLVYCAFVISVTVIALWKGYKILANCNFQKFIIILICSFMTIIFVVMILYNSHGMKKDIAILFSPLYIVLLVILFVPTKKVKVMWSYKYLIPEIFLVPVFVIYMCFRTKFGVPFEFLCNLFLYSIGLVYSGCVLLFFISDKKSYIAKSKKHC